MHDRKLSTLMALPFALASFAIPGTVTVAQAQPNDLCNRNATLRECCETVFVQSPTHVPRECCDVIEHSQPARDILKPQTLRITLQQCCDVMRMQIRRIQDWERANPHLEHKKRVIPLFMNYDYSELPRICRTGFNTPSSGGSDSGGNDRTVTPPSGQPSQPSEPSSPAINDNTGTGTPRETPSQPSEPSTPSSPSETPGGGRGEERGGGPRP
ncbi:MAG: hypothetical protein KKA05_05785 [Alphaproteobacteria bacterium]|nr:hypothetical protein [Alphaproteobacteria bacterium]